MNTPFASHVPVVPIGMESARQITPTRRLVVPVVLSLICLAGAAVPRSVHAQRPTPVGVRQARVAPETIRLPIVEGHDIRFSRLSATPGLSQVRVGQIAQDKVGFMWLGTQYGLNRFDGNRFK